MESTQNITLPLRIGYDKFAVYLHKIIDPETLRIDRIIYVGYGPIADVYNTRIVEENIGWSEAVKAVGGVIQIEIVGIHENRMDAILQARDLRRAYPGVTSRGRRKRVQVRCDQNGVTYASTSEAARSLQISQGALSNHLNGRAGYNSLHGMTFKRV